MEAADLDNRFAYHRPDAAKVQMHEAVRSQLRLVAEGMNSLLPETREKALVFTKLEEAMFWANAAIARHVPAAPEEV